jgi:hypothetical protein
VLLLSSSETFQLIMKQLHMRNRLSIKSIFFWEMTPCRLHGVISQKKILFKTTAVKTSNPDCLEFNDSLHQIYVCHCPLSELYTTPWQFKYRRLVFQGVWVQHQLSSLILKIFFSSSSSIISISYFIPAPSAFPDVFQYQAKHP